MSKTVTVTLEFNEADLLMLTRLMGAFPDSYSGTISENSTGLYQIFNKLATAYEATYGKEVYPEEAYNIHDALREGYLFAKNQIEKREEKIKKIETLQKRVEAAHEAYNLVSRAYQDARETFFKLEGKMVNSQIYYEKLQTELSDLQKHLTF